MAAVGSPSHCWSSERLLSYLQGNQLKPTFCPVTSEEPTTSTTPNLLHNLSSLRSVNPPRYHDQQGRKSRALSQQEQSYLLDKLGCPFQQHDTHQQRSEFHQYIQSQFPVEKQIFPKDRQVRSLVQGSEQPQQSNNEASNGSAYSPYRIGIDKKSDEAVVERSYFSRSDFSGCSAKSGQAENSKYPHSEHFGKSSKSTSATGRTLSDSTDSFFSPVKSSVSHPEFEGEGVDSSSLWARKLSGETRLDEIRRIFGGSKTSRKSTSKSVGDCSSESPGSALGLPIAFNDDEIGQKNTNGITKQIKKFEAYDNFRDCKRIVNSSPKVVENPKENLNPVKHLFERKLSISNIKEFNEENRLLGSTIAEKEKSKSTPEILNSSRFDKAAEVPTFTRLKEFPANQIGKVSDLDALHLKIRNQVPKLLDIRRKFSVDHSIGSSSEFFTPRSCISSPGLDKIRHRYTSSTKSPATLFENTSLKEKRVVPPSSNQNSGLGSTDLSIKNDIIKEAHPPASSSDSTEVVISDRESLTDSGDVNRRTVIHISRKKSVSSPSVETGIDHSCELSRNLKSRRKFASDRASEASNSVDDLPVTVGRIRVSIESKSKSENELPSSSSRMYVKLSDASNRPSRVSAFNVRQTIEKRAVEQERRERKLLRKKLKELIRSASENRERLSSTDSECSSVYVSCSSVRSKSLSSLDQDLDDIRCESPLVKVQSSPTLESEKQEISNYLYSSNLTDCSPCLSSRLVASAMSPTCLSPELTDSNNRSSRTRYISVTQPDKSKCIRSIGDPAFNGHVDSCRSPGTDNQSDSHDERSITDSEKWRMKKNSYLNDDLKIETNISENCESTSRSHKSTSKLSSLQEEKPEPAWVRFARERRSLRTNQLMLEDISERNSSIVSTEPDWVKRARKKLESLNLPLCSTTEVGSVSSHLTESSAWSRGGLDALDDLRQETSRIGIALAGEAQARVQQDLKRITKSNMLDYQKPVIKAPPSLPDTPNRVSFDQVTPTETVGEGRSNGVKWTTSQIPQAPREEVRFGDLKHDWGGVQTSGKTTASGKPKEMRFGELQVTDIPNDMPPSNLPEDGDIIQIRNRKGIIFNDTQHDSLLNSPRPVTHFGDTPFNIIPKGTTVEPKHSSKFESISGPDPTTMSAEQLNQNVEEYDFPIPTGNEDASELLKALEDSIKKAEQVPEVISTRDDIGKAKPKSILKRRSVENVYQETQKEDAVTERLKKWERRKSSPAEWTLPDEPAEADFQDQPRATRATSPGRVNFQFHKDADDEGSQSEDQESSSSIPIREEHINKPFSFEDSPSTETGLKPETCFEPTRSKSPLVDSILGGAPSIEKSRKKPVPLPRTSVKKISGSPLRNDSLVNENIVLNDNNPLKANKITSSINDRKFEPISSPRFVSSISAELDVKPAPRKIYTFKAKMEEDKSHSNADVTNGLGNETKPSDIKFLKAASIINRAKMSTSHEETSCPFNTESEDMRFIREKSLSLESRKTSFDPVSINSFGVKGALYSRRSLRESSSIFREDDSSADQDSLRLKSSGKQALIKLYDLPDGSVHSKSTLDSSNNEIVRKGRSVYVRENQNSSLLEWERVQRRNLEEEEKNRLNKSLTGKPVSTKIKEMVKFPGGGLKFIFAKDKKTDIMGTVDGADDIVFTRIPSGGKSTVKKDSVDGMKSPNIVKSILLQDANKKVTEESIYADVRNVLNQKEDLVSQEKPSSPVYVKTSTDRFDSELLFGDGSLFSKLTTTKQMNIERTKDIARAKVSPRQRNRSPRRLITTSTENNVPIQRQPSSSIGLKKSPTVSCTGLDSSSGEYLYYLGQKQSSMRRSLRETTPEKKENKIINSSSATSLVDYERKQRFQEASAVFRKEKANGKKTSWNEERIPLYTSSWKFLTPKTTECESDQDFLHDLPNYIESKSPPVRLTQIIGDSGSARSSALNTPLVSPRSSPDRSEMKESHNPTTTLNFIENEEQHFEKLNLFLQDSSPVSTETQVPEPPPRKSKFALRSDLLPSSSHLSEIKNSLISNTSDCFSGSSPPPVAPKRKSFLFGMENESKEADASEHAPKLWKKSGRKVELVMENRRSSKDRKDYESKRKEDHYVSSNINEPTGNLMRHAPSKSYAHTSKGYQDQLSPLVTQRISRREKPREISDKPREGRSNHRHASADRYTGSSQLRSRSRDPAADRKNDFCNTRGKETERRVKVTTYKWGEKLVRENTEKFKSPILNSRKDRVSDDATGRSKVQKKSINERSDWLGYPKGDEMERHRRSVRRRDYDERRNEMQRRSRSEGRPRELLGERLVSLERDYTRHGTSKNDHHTSGSRERRKRADGRGVSSSRRMDDNDQSKNSTPKKRHSTDKREGVYSSTKNENVYFAKKKSKRADEAITSTSAVAKAIAGEDRANRKGTSAAAGDGKTVGSSGKQMSAREKADERRRSKTTTSDKRDQSSNEGCVVANPRQVYEGAKKTTASSPQVSSDTPPRCKPRRDVGMSRGKPSFFGSSESRNIKKVHAKVEARIPEPKPRYLGAVSSPRGVGVASPYKPARSSSNKAFASGVSLGEGDNTATIGENIIQPSHVQESDSVNDVKQFDGNKLPPRPLKKREAALKREKAKYAGGIVIDDQKLPSVETQIEDHLQNEPTVAEDHLQNEPTVEVSNFEEENTGDISWPVESDPRNERTFRVETHVDMTNRPIHPDSLNENRGESGINMLIENSRSSTKLDKESGPEVKITSLADELPRENIHQPTEESPNTTVCLLDDLHIVEDFEETPTAETDDCLTEQEYKETERTETVGGSAWSGSVSVQTSASGRPVTVRACSVSHTAAVRIKSKRKTPVTV